MYLARIMQVVTLSILLIFPMKQINASPEVLKCQRIAATELAILAPALEAKLAAVEPAYKARVKFRSALICNNRNINAWFYTEMQSVADPDLLYLSWDIVSSKVEIE